MQCASSTTSKPIRSAIGYKTVSIKSWFAKRSGETSKQSTSPCSNLSLMRCHSSLFVEFNVSAVIPNRSAAATWLRIRASKGEMIIVGPAPRSRKILLAMKYTALFPQPVRWTTSSFRRWFTTASMASHCPSLKVAVVFPNIRCKSNSAPCFSIFISCDL